MSTDPAIVVNEFLNAVKTVDLAKVADLLDAHVRWSQPGNNEISGEKNSKEKVFEMVGKMFEVSGNTLQLMGFKTISVNDDRVAAVLDWTALKPSGAILNVTNIDVYTIASDKISKVEVFSTDQQQEDDFWKS
ncbi:nuclear transport factor 2 family protein [Dyadobacter sp. CY326]|uniref:nuclear transport factor 2 family protein n=1 Tax=Dyadobacter sp. CY326 TaxID=2907300 RepID=UPI001F1CD620|nr:nuclear transport factor 2 family protein [Dyadobacter sp. CY326]MCE7065276.1 nuclear transport factor 2 family protein [Dyadobacter sp. CY326]